MKKLLLLGFLIFSGLIVSAQELPPSVASYGEDEQLYNTVGLQVQPQFPGGIAEFQNYLTKSLRRKIDSKEKIMVIFVVEKDGSVNDVQIVKGGTEKDASRIKKVLLASPKWSPGIQNEKPVRTRFALPLLFN